MDAESRLTEALRTSRERGDAWYRPARLLQERFAGYEHRGRRTEVWDAAATATGLKPVVLKRLVVIMDRLDRVASETGVPVDELVSASYGAVELALRLYDRDRKEGLLALTELRSRRTTIEELQRRLSELPPGDADPAAVARSAALVHRSRRIRECRRALELYAPGEWGPYVEVAPRDPLRHFHRTGFEATDRGRVVAGFDLHLRDPALDSKDSPAGLARSLLLARSLPVFALVFGIGDAAAAGEAASASAELGMGWIGILTYGFEGPATAMRPPLDNPRFPAPEEYAAIKVAFAARTRRTQSKSE